VQTFSGTSETEIFDIPELWNNKMTIRSEMRGTPPASFQFIKAEWTLEK
jgi:hypothetical protein